MRIFPATFIKWRRSILMQRTMLHTYKLSDICSVLERGLSARELTQLWGAIRLAAASVSVRISVLQWVLGLSTLHLNSQTCFSQFSTVVVRPSDSRRIAFSSSSELPLETSNWAVKGHRQFRQQPNGLFSQVGYAILIPSFPTGTTTFTPYFAAFLSSCLHNILSVLTPLNGHRNNQI